MKYREFKRTGEKISLLGLGTMRFPIIDNDNSKIDEAEAIKMIRHAIDKGVNYIDTAYMYHAGTSENVLGKALQDGYREKVFIADKMPAWFAKEQVDVERIFKEQFERLGVDCIDMYLLHNITAPIWKICNKHNVLEFLQQKQKEGKIKHIGFSFHDDYELFETVLNAFPWDLCQIQLNYMDSDFQAGVKGLKLAGSKGIPVVVMEPLKGGRLTDAMPEKIAKLWKDAPIKRSPAEWALKWVANFPEVLTILSGTTTMEQLDENIKILSEAEPDSLTEKELSIIQSVSDEYNRLTKYSCTGCKYCLPCPLKINIPNIIQLFNEWYLYDYNPKTIVDYKTWNSRGRCATDCTSCNACEEKCPQNLPVAEIMGKAAEIFDK